MIGIAAILFAETADMKRLNYPLPRDVRDARAEMWLAYNCRPTC